MKSVINKYKGIIVPAMALALGIVSCKKDDVGSNELVRMFIPGDISVVSGDTIATLSWKASLYTTGNADVSYTIELSRDSLFAGTPELSQVTKNTSITVTDRQLAVKQKYFARLKANAAGNSEESHWLHSNSMTPIKGEQYMRPILDGELTDTKVTLRWVVNPGFTKITLTPKTGTPISVNLDPADITAGTKTISVLTPKTTYDAAIFLGPAQKGYLTFTSFAGTPTGANVVMVQPTDDLATILTTAAPGTTFVLQQGTKYTTDNPIVLPNNASFTIWGQTGPNRPILAFNVMTLPSTAGVIKFENLDITGYQNADPALTKRNYIFNQSAGSTTAEINFENCIIRNMGFTPLRVQGANPINIDRIVVNKCIVYDISNSSGGNYAFINNTVATSKFNNIFITNSTFYNIGFALIYHNLAPSTTVQVDNNTFYNTTAVTRYFIDYNAQIIGTFTFANNIIGKTISTTDSRGIRAGTAPSVGLNTYKTTDCIFSTNPIANVADYGKASTDLFTNPAAGNFVYKDVTFFGRSSCGDPRWQY
ncbi:hypothetical protein A4D02_05990 [Niastella koreensis]|uniref:Fibronectin type III domain protein n=2 Tax=Niastella koreensis TaxID=354356 RepID=G8TEV9_NIAKG|nr:DUF5123 domain-containing protein [Niastella koreensis]AEW01547.1 Fibronectin type III domain protein [Niastella koreensis GR20-10]OQP48266.1 hypothetical protein A4D02_05990 [Niastella koreensis]